MTDRSIFDTTVAVPGLPLSFRVAPLQGFLEVGLAAGQPMTAVEVQRVNAGFGPATVVLVHRPNGSIDLAVSDPRLDEAWFRQDPCMSHMPLGRIAPATFHRNEVNLGDAAQGDSEGRSVEVAVSLEADHLSGHLEITARHTFDRPGVPSFVPPVPGSGERPTLRLIMAGSIRGLPRRADPRVTLNGDRLELAPLMQIGPIVLARPARLGTDVFGVGVNLTGTVTVPPGSSRRPDAPVELQAGRGRHRFVLRLLSTDGEPRSTGTSAGKGHLVIDGSLGTVVTGSWRIERTATANDPPAIDPRPNSSVDGHGEVDGDSEVDGDGGPGAVTLELDGVTPRWSPGWRNPVGMAQYLARRRRRTGEQWNWSGTWRGAADGDEDGHTSWAGAGDGSGHAATHTGRWIVSREG